VSACNINNERNIEEGIHQEIKYDTIIELSAKNKITAIGALAVPVLRHSLVLLTRD